MSDGMPKHAASGASSLLQYLLLAAIFGIQRYFIPLDYYHMKSRIVSFLGLFTRECNQVIFNARLNFVLVCRRKPPLV